MKEITSLTLKLLIICVIVAGLLAFVNDVTQPIIALNEEKTFQKSMMDVLGTSDKFEKIDVIDHVAKDGVKLNSVYEGNNGGYAINTTCSEGYGGDINVMVGITSQLEVNKVIILSMSETPGLGAKANSPSFLNQFTGSTKGLEIIKNSEPHHNRISALSGATITSKAVTKAVNSALDVANFVNQEGGSN